MAEIKKECWSCTHYKPYYTKAFCQFDKQKNGYCTVSKEQVADKHQTCENWCNNHSLRHIRKEIALKSLIELLEKLEFLRIILAEEHEDNKIDPLQ